MAKSPKKILFTEVLLKRVVSETLEQSFSYQIDFYQSLENLSAEGLSSLTLDTEPFLTESEARVRTAVEVTLFPLPLHAAATGGTVFLPAL